MTIIRWHKDLPLSVHPSVSLAVYPFVTLSDTELCNQLLLQFSLDLSETLHTCYGHYKDCVWVFDGARIILKELQPFELSHFRHFLHSRVWSLCIINSYSFHWIFFETLHACCGHNQGLHVGFL